MNRRTKSVAWLAASLTVAAAVGMGCEKKTETPAPSNTTTSGDAGASSGHRDRNNRATTQPSSDPTSAAPSAPNTAAISGGTAVATIAPAKAAATQPANQNVTGTVTFTATGDGVKVVADLTGLSPGKHGIHIHEKTDMSDPGLKSVGGHWNPAGHKHGGTSGDERHAGDLGNLDADSSGKAHLEETIAGLTVGGGGKTDVIGHSVIVHAKEDDLKSDPSGNSGDRVAGGAIEARK